MLLCMLVALLLPQKLSMCGVGRVFFVARCVYVSLRCVDLDCRIIVFRRQFTSSVYFLHATPPGLCHCRLIAWLVELVLFYHSMVAARHVAQDKYAPHHGPCLSHSCLSLSPSLFDVHVPLLPPLSLTPSLSLLLALSGVYVVLC